MNFLKSKQAAIVTGGMFGGAVAGVLSSMKDISMLGFFIVILLGILLVQFLVRRATITNPFRAVKFFILATMIFSLAFIPVARSLLLRKFMLFDFDLLLFLPTLVIVGVSLLLSFLSNRLIK